MILEICAYNIASCFVAQRAGAHRIELCSAPCTGGLTASYGLLRQVLLHIDLPVYPIIRPKEVGFVLDAYEIEVLREDILMCRELGCRGISVGVACPDGTLDVEVFERIMEWAGPMGVTCHKVFDDVPNQESALEQLISVGVERVLTSGGSATAIQGATNLSKLVKQAAGRIAVMPGGGVRSGNIAALHKLVGAAEYHTSAIIDGGCNANQQEVSAVLDALR